MGDVINNGPFGDINFIEVGGLNSKPTVTLKREYKSSGDNIPPSSGGSIDIHTSQVSTTPEYTETLNYEDARLELKGFVLYRKYNVYNQNSPVGSIYDENDLLLFDNTKPLLWGDIIEDIGKFLSHHGWSLSATGSWASNPAPTQTYPWIDVATVLDGICSALLLKWNVAKDSKTIEIFEANSALAQPQGTIIDYKVTTKNDQFNGITVIGERELIENIGWAGVSDTGIFLDGSWYEYDPATKSTHKYDFTNYNDLEYITVKSILTPFDGWRTLTYIPPDAVVGIRIDDTEVVKLANADTGGEALVKSTWDAAVDAPIIVASEKGQLNPYLLSVPNQSVLLQMKVKKQFKKILKDGDYVWKLPYLQEVSYPTIGYNPNVKISKTNNPKFNTVVRVMDPETENISQDFESEFLEPTDQNSEIYEYIKPRKVELQRGIIWVSILDLLKIKKIDVKYGTARGTLNANGIPDVEMAKSDPIKYDSIIIEYEVCKLNDLYVRYCYKGDEIKIQKGGGGQTIKVPNAIRAKYEGSAADDWGGGFNGYGVPFFSQQALRDDTQLLEKFATQYFDALEYNIHSYRYAGTTPPSSLNYDSYQIDLQKGVTDLVTSEKPAVRTPYLLPLNQVKSIRDAQDFVEWQANDLFGSGTQGAGAAKYSILSPRYEYFLQSFSSTNKNIKAKGGSNVKDNSIGSKTSQVQQKGIQKVQGTIEGRKPDTADQTDTNTAQISKKNSLHINSAIHTKLNGMNKAPVYSGCEVWVDDHLPVDSNEKKIYPLASSYHQHGANMRKWNGTSWDTKNPDKYQHSLCGGGNIVLDFLDSSLKANLDLGDTLVTQFTNLTTNVFIDPATQIANPNKRMLATGEWIDITTQEDLINEAPLLTTYVKLEHPSVPNGIKGYTMLMIL